MKVIWLITPLLVLTACGFSPRKPTPTAMLAQTELATPSYTPTLPSEQPSLVFFTSEPGKFQAWLPISGSVDEFTVTKTLFDQPVDCSIIGSKLNGAYAIVQYCDLIVESVASLSSDEIFEQARDELFRDFNLRFDDEQKDLVDGLYPALTLSGRANMRGLGFDGDVKARMVWAENRIYVIVMSVYSTNWCNCRHQIDEVVDSLYIDPDLSIPFEPTP